MADQIAAFTPEQARLLWQDYQERKQLKAQLQQNFPQRRIIDEPSPHRVFVRNDSGETIPAYGCMQVTGTDVVAGRTVVTVNKPFEDDGEYLINSQFEIPAIGEESEGVGWAYRFGVVIFLGSPPAGPTQYRPIVNSWEIEEGDGPFVIYGEHNAATNALIGRIAAGEPGDVDPIDLPETNPGVVTVEILTESSCAGESFEDLGFWAFVANITSRPVASPPGTEMRREQEGQLTIFDPTGCILDADYDAEDFIEATAFVSLMYGGEPYDKTFDFKDEAVGSDYVLTTDIYPTLRPTDDCKPFGWEDDEPVLKAFPDAIGIEILDPRQGPADFKVLLPERGRYRITIDYGDANESTRNNITILDGPNVLDVIENESDEGEVFNHEEVYDFVSLNRPMLIVRLSNIDDEENEVDGDTRIIKLVVLQVSEPTRWEVINRCCIPRDGGA